MSSVSARGHQAALRADACLSLREMQRKTEASGKGARGAAVGRMMPMILVMMLMAMLMVKINNLRGPEQRLLALAGERERAK